MSSDLRRAFVQAVLATVIFVALMFGFSALSAAPAGTGAALQGAVISGAVFFGLYAGGEGAADP